MIEITIYRKDINDGAPCYDCASYICGYRSEGDSDYVPCAVVSVLTQMPVIGMQSCGYKPEIEYSQPMGLLAVRVPESAIKNSAIQLLLDTMSECLGSVALQYGDVKVREVEENEQKSKI